MDPTFKILIAGAGPAGMATSMVLSKNKIEHVLIDKETFPRDSNDLKLAADALVLGQATLSGQTATINSVKYEERRAAYDAPNWITTSRAVRFAELVSNQNELQVNGRRLVCSERRAFS